MAGNANSGRKPKTLAARTVRIGFDRFDRARAILESLLAGTLKPAVTPAGYTLDADTGAVVAIRPADNAKAAEWRAYADRVAALPKVQADYTAANLNVLTLANAIREGMEVTRESYAESQASQTEK